MGKDDWDFDTAVVEEGNKKARVVVSVAMPTEDFEALCREAEAHSLPVSTYIREKVRNRLGDMPIEVTAGVSPGASLTLILGDGRQVS